MVTLSRLWYEDVTHDRTGFTMTGMGQVTNTRTVDVALGDMIERLEAIDQTRAVTRILVEARRYHVIMQAWEGQPPPSGEQFQVIGDVMQLLGVATQLVEAAGGDPGIPVPRTTPAGMAPVARPTPAQVMPTPRPTPVQATPVQAVTGDGLTPIGGIATPGLTAGQASSGRQRSAATGAAQTGSSSSARKHTIGRVSRKGALPSEESADPAATPSSSSGIRLLRPYMMPWQVVPGTAGVALKLLHEDSADGHSHALARLESSAELPSHTHGSCETVYVLDGCITHGDVLVHAGECVCFEAGSTSGPLRSRGESLLLLICSDRSWLMS